MLDLARLGHLWGRAVLPDLVRLDRLLGRVPQEDLVRPALLAAPLAPEARHPPEVRPGQLDRAALGHPLNLEDQLHLAARQARPGREIDHSRPELEIVRE